MAQGFTAVSLLLLCTSTCLADVEGCSDGNTCSLRESVYAGDIKIFCINAPTLNKPFGVEARDALRSEVRGTIQVMMDHMEGRKPVAELIRDDGLNLGLELVKRGLAKVAKGCNEVTYRLAETEAMKASLGLWGLKQ